MEKKKTKKTTGETERIHELAGKITTLWPFIAMLIPDKDLIEQAAKGSSDQASFAASAAPILGAYGIDYEEREFNANLNYRRAKALYNLVDTLDQTEKDRTEFLRKQQSKAEGRAQLASILGP